MSEADSLKAVRLKKLALLRDFGMQVFPSESKKDFYLKDVKEKFDEIGSKKDRRS